MIYYTGIGSHISGCHTEREFLIVMQNIIPELRRRERCVPDFTTFTLQDWIEYSGAERL
jgi:hypothetical protein